LIVKQPRIVGFVVHIGIVIYSQLRERIENCRVCSTYGNSYLFIIERKIFAISKKIMYDGVLLLKIYNYSYI